MITYSISSSARSTRSSAPRIAIEPSSVALLSASAPPSLPNGVRTAETITERGAIPLSLANAWGRATSIGQMRRLLLLVSAIMLVDTTFFTALTPLLPHYADTLSLSKTGAGILIAAFGAGTLLGAIPAGMLAARVGPKPVILLGLGVLGVTSLVFGFGGNALLL